MSINIQAGRIWWKSLCIQAGRIRGDRLGEVWIMTNLAGHEYQYPSWQDMMEEDKRGSTGGGMQLWELTTEVSGCWPLGWWMTLWVLTTEVRGWMIEEGERKDATVSRSKILRNPWLNVEVRKERGQVVQSRKWECRETEWRCKSAYYGIGGKGDHSDAWEKVSANVIWYEHLKQRSVGRISKTKIWVETVVRAWSEGSSEHIWDKGSLVGSVSETRNESEIGIGTWKEGQH